MESVERSKAWTNLISIDYYVLLARYISINDSSYNTCTHNTLHDKCITNSKTYDLTFWTFKVKYYFHNYCKYYTLNILY